MCLVDLTVCTSRLVAGWLVCVQLAEDEAKVTTPAEERQWSTGALTLLRALDFAFGTPEVARRLVKVGSCRLFGYESPGLTPASSGPAVACEHFWGSCACLTKACRTYAQGQSTHLQIRVPNTSRQTYVLLSSSSSWRGSCSAPCSVPVSRPAVLLCSALPLTGWHTGWRAEAAGAWLV